MPARKITGREVIGVFLGSFGFKVFMLLSLTPAGLPHPTAALSPGTTWMVNPFKGFYRGKNTIFGSLADDILRICRVMNFSDH